MAIKGSPLGVGTDIGGYVDIRLIFVDTVLHSMTFVLGTDLSVFPVHSVVYILSGLPMSDFPIAVRSMLLKDKNLYLRS